MFYDYAYSIEQFKRGVTYYWDSFEENMYWKYPELRPYLRYGSVNAQTYFEEIPKTQYYKLKELLLIYPNINQQTKYLRDRDEVGVSYGREIFTVLNLTQTDKMVRGLLAIDRGSIPDIYFNLMSSCGNEQDYNCIGKGLTNYFKAFTDNVHSVNVMVELYMQENPWYNLTDLETIQKVIENEVYLFEDDLDVVLNNIESTKTDDSSKEIVYVEVPVNEETDNFERDSLMMLFVMVVLIVIIVSLIIVSSKDKK
jgi:hypothetical protein